MNITIFSRKSGALLSKVMKVKFMQNHKFESLKLPINKLLRLTSKVNKSKLYRRKLLDLSLGLRFCLF